MVVTCSQTLTLIPLGAVLLEARKVADGSELQGQGGKHAGTCRRHAEGGLDLESHAAQVGKTTIQGENTRTFTLACLRLYVCVCVLYVFSPHTQSLCKDFDQFRACFLLAAGIKKASAKMRRGNMHEERATHSSSTSFATVIEKREELSPLRWN